MEGFNMDNVMEGISFDDIEVEGQTPTESTEEGTKPEESKEPTKTKKVTTEIDGDSIFSESESVGSSEEEKDTGQEDSSSQGEGSNPNKFFSSIATALAEEGVFPDLDEETINKISTPEDFKNIIESQIKAGLDTRTQRVNEALDAGLKPDEVKYYENTLNYLSSLNEETIRDESDAGENLRKQLIFQDFINRGYSKERAEREVEKSLNAGSDIEDSLEALASNKEFFNGQYTSLVEAGKKREEDYKKELKRQSESLTKSILEDKDVYGEFEVSKDTRKMIIDNISKPVYKDKETGEFLTALQKYERENRVDFVKNLGLVFTLTDGFKNFNGLTEGKVKQGVKKGLRELESVLNNTSRTKGGSLSLANGKTDSESIIGHGWNLDI